MGFFRPGMFAKRGVTSAPKEQETPAPCDVCGLEGHTRDTCWTAIRSAADLDRTWGRSGRPEQSNSTGATFDEMREWWRRMQEER